MIIPCDKAKASDQLNDLKKDLKAMINNYFFSDVHAYIVNSGLPDYILQLEQIRVKMEEVSEPVLEMEAAS